MVILAPQSLCGLFSFQPMRYLHLVYFFLMLLARMLPGKVCVKGYFHMALGDISAGRES